MFRIWRQMWGNESAGWFEQSKLVDTTRQRFLVLETLTVLEGKTLNLLFLLATIAGRIVNSFIH